MNNYYNLKNCDSLKLSANNLKDCKNCNKYPKKIHLKKI